MRTYYEGPTYTVAFDENDTACFAHHTDADAAVVRGEGAFVFDTRTGDLLEARGAAKGRTEMEWLAFSQDAQDFAQLELSRHGIRTNPFDFSCDLPEISNPAKARKAKGGTPEIGRTVVLVQPGQHTRHNPGAVAYIANVDDDGDVWVLWQDGDWSVLAEDDEWEMPASYNPDDLRISRTRGSKTPGPYSVRRGYRAWINQRGKLGDGFLTTMTKKERHEALDRCVQAHNYRSCLGSIMVLERAHRGPRGQGQGVGIRYAQQLAESRKYLRTKYGGAGSFGPRASTPARARAANPEAAVHRERMEGYLYEAGQALRATKAAADGGKMHDARGFFEDAKRNILLATHEGNDAELDDNDRGEITETLDVLNETVDVLQEAFFAEQRSTAPAASTSTSNPKKKKKGARA